MLRSKKLSFYFFALIFLISFSRSEDQDCSPQQIRLSLGDLYYNPNIPNLRLPSEKLNFNQAYLVWLTKTKKPCDFTVSIKDESDNSLQTTTKPVAFHENYYYNFKDELEGEKPGEYYATSYTVLLDKLKYDCPYSYKIIEPKSQKSSDSVSFSLPTPNITADSKKILVLGGIDNSEKGNITIKKLASETLAENKYSALLHLGSLAQNLHDIDGKSSDIFYKSIQTITSKIPYLISPGSQDSFDNWKLLNFRTKNPLYNKTHNHYYSFDLQGIHFVSISFSYYYQSAPDVQKEMFSWIENDLKASNDHERRAFYPWIVIISDSPIYCLNNENTAEAEKCSNYYSQKKDWENLLNEYSVDLMISNHYNSYERMGPIYKNKLASYIESPEDSKKSNIKDPKGTVFLIEGAGVDKSNKNPTNYTAHSYGYVVDKNSGYGVLSTSKSDSGELKLIYEHYNSETGQVIDTMNIIKTNAGGSHRNRTPYFLFVVLMVIGVILITGGLLLLRRKRRAEESEDNIPLTSGSPMRSKRSRYSRPGERGIKMIDLVSC